MNALTLLAGHGKNRPVLAIATIIPVIALVWFGWMIEAYRQAALRSDKSRVW